MSVRFSPKLPAEDQARFLRLVSHLASMPTHQACATAIARAIECAADAEAGLPYVTALSVLQDVVTQGWSLKIADHTIVVAPPQIASPPGDPREYKAKVRSTLELARRDQLDRPSVQAFIRRMERPKRHQDGTVTILNLVADGRAIAHALSSAQTAEALGAIVIPYLQLVQPGMRDEHTGYALSDIWRYFRYTWSIPYGSTPGRNMYYLLRDAGQPYHPIMGIAALGSSLIQLTCRDDAIGWTTAAVAQRMERRHSQTTNEERISHNAHTVSITKWTESPETFTLRTAIEARTILDQVRGNLIAGLTELRYTLGGDSSDQLPSTVVARVLASRIDNPIAATTEFREHSDWAIGHDSSLFRSKRERVAHRLTRALQTLATVEGMEPSAAIRTLLHTERGRHALLAGLNVAKKERVGSNMMDIIVCGAIPPYNHLLAGKLMAMLIASPRVVTDYRNKYQNAVSVIASYMAGKPIVRNADLVFLGTTSLYQVGSSQYNRIRYPGGCGTLEYKDLGRTDGYGSVHFSRATIQAMRDLLRAEGAPATSRFGEGVNPKIRLIRQALTVLGLPTSLLKHDAQRIVYGVVLAHNAAEYLRGETSEPQWVLDLDNPDAATDRIVSFWVERWLAKRVHYVPAMQRMRDSKPTDLQLSHSLHR